jgi:hypothetical protein
MQISKFIVNPTHAKSESAAQDMQLPERLNLTPSNRGNVSIFPEDKPQGSFHIDRMYYVHKYPSKSDFCKSLLSMQNRSCDHIVSRDEFDAKALKQILTDTAGRNQNIVYYRWSGVDECLEHVSIVYIDKKDQKIYFMPDMSLDLSNPYVSRDLGNKLQEFQKFSYEVCLPIGSFFKSDTGKDSQNLQSDGNSCSFLSQQIGQKCDHMNSSAACGKIKIVSNTTLLMDLKQIDILENGKKLSWIPFHKDDMDSTQNAKLFYEASKAFILPNEFYGTTQRLAPIVLNEFLLNRLFPGQENSVYNRKNEKQSSRALWNTYFGFPFDSSSDQNKFEKTLARVKTISGMESDYKQKTSQMRKAYDLNLISPETLESAIQIAKDVYAIFKLPPTQFFFKKLGVALNSPEHDAILGEISPDLSHAASTPSETKDIPDMEVDARSDEDIPDMETYVGSDEDIPDMDDFDLKDNILT